MSSARRDGNLSGACGDDSLPSAPRDRAMALLAMGFLIGYMYDAPLPLRMHMAVCLSILLVLDLAQLEDWRSKKDGRYIR